MTYWVNPGVTLRFRIQHSGYDVAPDECVCEVADARRGHAFREVGRLAWHPDVHAHVHTWPCEWPSSFQKLANLWFVLAAIAEWGLALGATRVVHNNGDLPEAAIALPDGPYTCVGESHG